MKLDSEERGVRGNEGEKRNSLSLRAMHPIELKAATVMIRGTTRTNQSADTESMNIVTKRMRKRKCEGK